MCTCASIEGQSRATDCTIVDTGIERFSARPAVVRVYETRLVFMPFVEVAFVDVPFVDVPFVDMPFVDVSFGDVVKFCMIVAGQDGTAL